MHVSEYGENRRSHFLRRLAPGAALWSKTSSSVVFNNYITICKITKWYWLNNDVGLKDTRKETLIKAQRDIWVVLPPKPSFHQAQRPYISTLSPNRDVSSIFAPSSRPQQLMRVVISAFRQALIVWLGSKHKLVAHIFSVGSSPLQTETFALLSEKVTCN